MRVLNSVFVIYLIFGYAALSAADLFDTVGGLIGFGDEENPNPNLNVANPNMLRGINNDFSPNQFVPNLNYNNNNNFRGNNQFLPNNNFNNNNNRPINNRPNNNFGRPTNNPINRPVVEQFKDDFSSLTEEEKKAAQQMPGLGNLLEKLREMNRQKELQKQKENGQNGGNNINNNGNGINNNGINNGNNNGWNGNNNNINGERAMNGWKVVHKRKFAFQAKPVRPENDLVLANDKVYYLD